MTALPPKIKNIFVECEGFKPLQKPIIGVSTNRAEGTSRVADAYINAVINAGGVPILIPGFANLELLTQIIELCDGILLTGGGDISPDILGEEALPEVGTPCEERDRQEIALVHISMKRQIPLLGICRGHQVINVACGGKNYQDIAKQHTSTPLCHSQEEVRNVATHEVEVVKDSLLAKILGGERVMNIWKIIRKIKSETRLMICLKPNVSDSFSVTNRDNVHFLVYLQNKSKEMNHGKSF